jgi:arylsulfatase A-like enzyme
MRVPFIAAWARSSPNNAFQQRLPIASNSIQSQLAAVYDLFPTILAVAGTPSPNDHTVDGFRLDVLLSGRPDAARDETFLMHYPHSPHRSDYFTCYRNGQWKVIYHYWPSEASDGSHYQLFDLAADPFESRNLAAENPAKLRELMQGLIANLESHNALYPVDKTDGARPILPKLP